MTTAIAVIAAYLVGSIPWGVIVGRLGGFDPRTVGSGNIGMTNVARAGGARAALATFAGDVLKGALPVAAARAAGLGPQALALTGLAAFVGSISSVLLRFRGGKGVAAALGVWVALAPLPLLFSLAAFGIVLAATRIMSLASMSAAVVLVPAVALLALPRSYLFLAIVMSALVLVRHHQNIRRLLAGEERPFEPGGTKRGTA